MKVLDEHDIKPIYKARYFRSKFKLQVKTQKRVGTNKITWPFVYD